MTASAEALDMTIDNILRVQLSQTAATEPFLAQLINEETRRYEDDPTPDITEELVAERTITGALPVVITAVDRWLRDAHHLHVLPDSWTVCEAGGDTGVLILLEGQATPAFMQPWPLGRWS